MNVPFVDLHSQYKLYSDEINLIISSVLKNGVFIGGKEVDRFEKKFASYIGASHCISLNSGTDALILGTRALELNSYDEIIFPANTYYSTIIAAVTNGIKPVLADINESDYGYDISKLKEKINSRTKAIMVVHLYGQSDKLSEIQSIIRKVGKKIYLLEDACQAHGAKFKNRKVGTFGTFGAFSFYPTKNLGAYGDGGAIITNEASLAKKIRRLKEYGQSKKYFHESIGVNSRLDTIQAAILSFKLQKLNEWNKKRQLNASLYNKLLSNIPGVKIPVIFPERKSIYHLYVVRIKKRELLQKFLLKRGIVTQIHYPFPIHRQRAWQYLKFKNSEFPVSDKLSKEILSLPMYPELTKTQVEYVSKTVKDFYKV